MPTNRNPARLLALITLAAFLLSGATCSTKRLVTTEPGQVNLQCDDRCFIACDEKPPKFTDESDQPADEDDRLALLGQYKKECEVRRSLCVECIERGRATGRVK